MYGTNLVQAPFSTSYPIVFFHKSIHKQSIMQQGLLSPVSLMESVLDTKAQTFFGQVRIRQMQRFNPSVSTQYQHLKSKVR